ncbi:MAG: cupin domain-containing protein [Armatimonadetes bacterium]|nr:cupin domain-containing protein [Armatimonadota bacterium]
MSNLRFKWADMPQDHPIDLLHRRSILGKNLLVAMVNLEKGCKVNLHHHDNEQMAYVVSGHVKWGIGEPGTAQREEFEMHGGEVLHLPSNLPHEVVALEDTVVIDMLAPPGPMGIDSQKK